MSDTHTIRISDKDWQALKYAVSKSNADSVNEYINYVLAEHLKAIHGIEWEGLKPRGSNQHKVKTP